VLGRLARLKGWPPHPIGRTALQPGRWGVAGDVGEGGAAVEVGEAGDVGESGVNGTAGECLSR
jgi:hypothetical protein